MRLHFVAGPNRHVLAILTKYLFSTISLHRRDERNAEEYPVVDNRKRAISIRIGANDLRNVKRIARRLAVRDSDVIRFAIKSMLHRISPLCDEAMTGRSLVPVLVESGDELIRFFELDAFRLDSIVNDRALENGRVDRDDIALLAMSGLREHYLVLRTSGGGASEDAAARPQHSLRMYLFDKYLRRNEDSKGQAPRTEAEPRAEMQRPAA
jgi:hypothetical protein